MKNDNRLHIGIFLVALGILFLIIVFGMYKEAYSTPSELIQGRYADYDMVMFYLFLVLGLILLIGGLFETWVGLVVKSKENIETKKPTDTRHCTNCGRYIDMDYQLCPYCGKDFRIK
jgi:mannose/fructose/N-acetylgalactosamine-specific phosphotransferase system component IID